MELTITYLRNKFNQFNKEFFNNELPQIEIKISRSKRQFGSYRFKRANHYCPKETPVAILISNYYQQTGKEYCETLIHEMIHYYLSFKNIGRKDDCHGYYFQKEMKRINESQSTYKITIHGCSAGLTSKNEIKGKVYRILVFEYNGRKYLSRVSDRFDPEKQQKNFKDCRFISINSTTNPKADKMINRTSKLSLVPLTTDLVNEYKLVA